MIPRYQIVIFSVLVIASLAMGGILWHLRQRAHERLIAGVDSAPTKAPEVAPSEQATLIVANDDDNSLLDQVHSLPLPSDPESRARAVLARLLDVYAAPNSIHPVPGGATSVSQVFLLPIREIPKSSRLTASPGEVVIPNSPPADVQGGPELAVVNLTSTFVASHPSGLETETLTVLSICGTLHANLPRITQVRFLVDGEERPSLAGHADLTRTYLAAEAVPITGARP